MKIKVNDKLPNSEFFYLDNNNLVQIISTIEIFKNQRAIILGMPGAFTKVCSSKHLPGFVNNFDLAQKKGINKIICIAVNDPNVMKAWGQNQKVEDKILMYSDPFCKFTKLIPIICEFRINYYRRCLNKKSPDIGALFNHIG